MKTLLRWWNARAGVVTLELALVGPALVGLLLLTAELGFLLYAQMALDFAAREAARNMATGQAEAGDAPSFQSLVFCPFLAPLLSCTGVSVVLQPVTDFQSAMTSVPTSTFSAGGSGSLMLLQATYTSSIPLWPLNVTQLIGTAAYWNEF